MSRQPLAKCPDGHVLAWSEVRDGEPFIKFSEGIGGFSLRPEKGGKPSGRFNIAENWTRYPLPALEPSDDDRASRAGYCKGCRMDYDLDVIELGRILRTHGAPSTIQPV